MRSRVNPQDCPRIEYPSIHPDFTDTIAITDTTDRFHRHFRGVEPGTGFAWVLQFAVLPQDYMGMTESVARSVSNRWTCYCSNDDTAYTLITTSIAQGTCIAKFLKRAISRCLGYIKYRTVTIRVKVRIRVMLGFYTSELLFFSWDAGCYANSKIQIYMHIISFFGEK